MLNAVWFDPGENNLSDRQAGFEQDANFVDIGCHFDVCSFLRSGEQKDFVAVDALFGQKRVAVGADEDLSAPITLRAEYNRGKLRHNRGIQRKFRFLQQEERVTFGQRPQKADQTERAIGELIFSLQACLRAPVKVESLKMRPLGCRVANKLELLKLRHRDFQGLLDF